MYVCMYVCMYVRMYVCMYVRTYVRMYVCMYHAYTVVNGVHKGETHRHSVPAGTDNRPVSCASYFWTSDSRKYPTEPSKLKPSVCYSRSFRIILWGRNGNDSQPSYPLTKSSRSSWDPWSNLLGTLQRSSKTVSQDHWRNIIWLVVSSPLKNIHQLGWLFPIYGNSKHVPNHQPV